MRDKFDKNLSIENVFFDKEVNLYDITREPFKIYGNCNEAKSVFFRMPENIAEHVSDGVLDRAKRAAGIRLRFKTNSKRMGIKVRFLKAVQFPAQSAISTKGFDVYVDGEYYSSVFCQDINLLSYEQMIDFANVSWKDIIIYFPYNAVIEEFTLALDNNALVTKGNKYKVDIPIVFYGSSITHGFCVSRPGNSFTAMLSRKLDVDYINLGFSGVCRGEPCMAKYLASLKKSLFVCGYDHNEPCLEDLKKRHLPFYLEYRDKDPKSPILFVSSPNKICHGEVMKERMKVVEATYKYAIQNGDKNVYFLNGQNIYPRDIGADCSADSIHPNDLGAYMISEKMYEILKKILY